MKVCSDAGLWMLYSFMLSSQLLLRKRSRRCIFQLTQQHCKTSTAHSDEYKVTKQWYDFWLEDAVLNTSTSCVVQGSWHEVKPAHAHTLTTCKPFSQPHVCNC